LDFIVEKVDCYLKKDNNITDDKNTKNDAFSPFF